jgi:hypothetical protein
VHRADHHVDLVALDQLGGVLRRLGRIGLVIDLEVFDLAAAQLAALLLHVHPEAVLDGHAEGGISAVYGSMKPTLILLDVAGALWASATDPVASSVATARQAGNSLRDALRCMGVSSLVV